MPSLYWLPFVFIYSTCIYFWATTKRTAPDHPLGYSKPSQQTFDLPTSEQDKPDLISLFILPKDHGCFTGYELIQTLGSAQMHFGEHQMFHRLNEQGHILFSLCRSEAPGHFEYNQIGHMKAAGITLFIDTTNALFCPSILDQFLDTTSLIAEDLSASISNEHMQTLSPEDFQDIKTRYFSHEPAHA
ncbi:cell division protein ZipA C-terminal FtsZ-binding domain-containing protein [Gammaproteobacteria bacterium]|nr:cell division protein ZipA C-terminal FtsZ-binding domain-containing protein [Gammaproteobacteria bacterium]